MEVSGREDLGVWPWILGKRSTVGGPKNGMKRPKKRGGWSQMAIQMVPWHVWGLKIAMNIASNIAI